MFIFNALSAFTQYGSSYSNSTMSSSENAISDGAMAVLVALYCCVLLFLYIYTSAMLYVIAKKTGHKDKAIFAFIPLANLYLMSAIAKKPNWFFWLMGLAMLSIIPCIGFFANLIMVGMLIVLWMEIARARNVGSWLGCLTFFPILNLFALAYIAFADSQSEETAT